MLTMKQLRCPHSQGGQVRCQQVTSRTARLQLTVHNICQVPLTPSSCCSAPTGRVSSSDCWAAKQHTTVVERGNLATLAAAICICFGFQQNYAAFSKPALLDLPACTNYQQAGTIKYGCSGIPNGDNRYCEVQPGSGESPLAGDLIVVDYTARAVSTGEVYDGSRNFKFTVGNGEVIPGWEQGILGTADLPAVKEGGARTLLIPPELAYGSEGDGCLFGLSENCRIPPNSPVEITFKYRGLGY